MPSKELMYRAAYGVYLAYDSRRGEGAVSNGMHERNLMPDGWQGKRIAILTGGGNNGGDGYALAWILKEAGIDSTVIRVSEKLSEDGRYYCEKAEACGVAMRDFAKPEAGGADMRDSASAVTLGASISDFAGSTDLSGYDVIVDCILGTGFRGEVRGSAAEAIKAINKSGAYVISVDINSGMNGDTGEAALAVRSDLTVSIQAGSVQRRRGQVHQRTDQCGYRHHSSERVIEIPQGWKNRRRWRSKDIKEECYDSQS